MWFRMPSQLLSDFCAALTEGRSQAQRVRVAAIDRDPATYQQVVAACQGSRSQIHDMYSDPYGWSAGQTSSCSGSGSNRGQGATAVAASSELQTLQDMCIQVATLHHHGLK